ncbi:MAG: HAD family hydrolase [Actinomycetota bacterium]|nr:HAD family hydrolase [Actinomycetota bacterium]
MTNIKAVVFDLDGTLLDHEGASLSGVSALLTALGVDEVPVAQVMADWHRLEEIHWVAYRAGITTFEEQRRLRLRDFLPVVGRSLPDDDLDATFAAYLSGYESGWVAFDDAAPVIHRARATGLGLAVLTNGLQEQQEAKLRAVGLLDVCGTVLASSSLPAGKPDPGAYAAACAAVHEAPESVLMVGDNYELDVLAARGAGLQAVHLDRAGTHCVPDSDRVRTLADLAL